MQARTPQIPRTRTARQVCDTEKIPRPVCLFTLTRHNGPVTKKIDTALKDLTHALEKHAQIVGLKPIPLKKAGRAAAELRSAATAYATIVEQKTGQTNPFIDFLDAATIESLTKEREFIAARKAAEAKAEAKAQAKAEAKDSKAGSEA
ncbi:hypothetical protein EDF46_1129 [Frondihabitans sp. PhB188]|nr:hypothetical protein EDF46_1129 [Frondihabitans sp. PhB188]